MDGPILQALASGGAFAIVLGLLLRGMLATRQEVEAWRSRAERAERQVDTLLPAMQTMTANFKDVTTSFQLLASSGAIGGG